MLAAPALQEDSGGDLEDFYDCRIARRVPDRFNDDLPLRIRRECPETIREVFCYGQASRNRGQLPNPCLSPRSLSPQASPLCLGNASGARSDTPYLSDRRGQLTLWFRGC